MTSGNETNTLEVGVDETWSSLGPLLSGGPNCATADNKVYCLPGTEI